MRFLIIILIFSYFNLSSQEFHRLFFRNSLRPDTSLVRLVNVNILDLKTANNSIALTTYIDSTKNGMSKNISIFLPIGTKIPPETLTLIFSDGDSLNIHETSRITNFNKAIFKLTNLQIEILKTKRLSQIILPEFGQFMINEELYFRNFLKRG
jgi:hypothetical protein